MPIGMGLFAVWVKRFYWPPGRAPSGTPPGWGGVIPIRNAKVRQKPVSPQWGERTRVLRG